MSGQTLQKAFIPLPGRATAVYTSSGLSYYRHPDWLGSARFGSTPSRTMYSDVAYAPFGEPYAQAGATDLSFTGINQDTDSDSFDFPARQYSTQGRWASPDPAGLAAVDPAFPQSWNHYAYVMNNPLALIDPFGLDFCQWDDGSKDDRPEDGGEGLGGCLDQGGTWVTEGGAGDGCISTMIGSGIQVTCPGPPDPCALPGSCGGGAGGGATLSAPPGLITAIGPQTNWAHSRQEQCLEEAAKAFAGGIVMKKEIDALLTPILGAPQTDGPVGPSVVAVTAEVGLDRVAENRPLIGTIRAALRQEGWKVSGNAIARGAKFLSRAALVTHVGFAAADATEAYDACMAN